MLRAANAAKAKETDGREWGNKEARPEDATDETTSPTRRGTREGARRPQREGAGRGGEGGGKRRGGDARTAARGGEGGDGRERRRGRRAELGPGGAPRPRSVRSPLHRPSQSPLLVLRPHPGSDAVLASEREKSPWAILSVLGPCPRPLLPSPSPPTSPFPSPASRPALSSALPFSAMQKRTHTPSPPSPPAPPRTRTRLPPAPLAAVRSGPVGVGAPSATSRSDLDRRDDRLSSQSPTHPSRDQSRAFLAKCARNRRRRGQAAADDSESLARRFPARARPAGTISPPSRPPAPASPPGRRGLARRAASARSALPLVASFFSDLPLRRRADSISQRRHGFLGRSGGGGRARRARSRGASPLASSPVRALRPPVHPPARSPPLPSPRVAVPAAGHALEGAIRGVSNSDAFPAPRSERRSAPPRLQTARSRRRAAAAAGPGRGRPRAGTFSEGGRAGPAAAPVPARRGLARAIRVAIGAWTGVMGLGGARAAALAVRRPFPAAPGGLGVPFRDCPLAAPARASRLPLPRRPPGAAVGRLVGRGRRLPARRRRARRGR